jgi:hypothetical protein
MEQDLNQKIVEKINHYYESTDSNVVGVGYGFKKSKGSLTGKQSIIFTVKEKKNISELNTEDILPSTIEVNGVNIETDVVVGSFKSIASACEGSFAAPSNNSRFRPIMGGVSIENFEESAALGYGTMGLLAVDSNTNSVVGLTNGHVIIKDQFICSDRSFSFLRENSYNQNIVQPENGSISDTVGKVKRYLPLKNNGYNYADAAIFTIKKEDITSSGSINQVGFIYNTPLQFATTQELNDLISINPNCFFSGRTSGARGEGDIKLKIQQINASAYIDYNLQGVSNTVDFANCIEFYAQDSSISGNPTINCAVNPGDSGSVLVADLYGTRKVIGLIFAAKFDPATGAITAGLANRIDDVASLIQISSWNGNIGSLLESDVDASETHVEPGLDSREYIDVNGKRFWQVGIVDNGNNSIINNNFNPHFIIKVSNNGSAYQMSGRDKSGELSGNNPTLSFYSGSRVRFEVNSPSHPFLLSITGGVSSQVNGINSGIRVGVIDWTVPSSGIISYRSELDNSIGNSVSLSSLQVKDSARPLFNRSSFSIVPQPYRNYLNQAVDRWEQYIRFNPLVWDAIKANSSFSSLFNGIYLLSNGLEMFNDNTDGTIAYCGIYNYWDLVTTSSSVKFNAINIQLGINQAYEYYYTPAEWVDVLTHELGHGLGIGIFWIPELQTSGSVPPSNHFLSGSAYLNCRSGYRQVINNAVGYNKIPLEDFGSSGTAGGHWENSFRSADYPYSDNVLYPGLINELMIGYINEGGNMRISPISIGALKDFGYEELNPGNHEGYVHLINSSSRPVSSLECLPPKSKLSGCCLTHSVPKKVGETFLNEV